MGEKRNAYEILVGKSEDKRPLGKPRRRWVDNIMTKGLKAGIVDSIRTHHFLGNKMGQNRVQL
jgi:hypothetical protein